MQTSDTLLERWLHQHGFSQNPFELREAGQEPELSSYYIEHPSLNEIWGSPLSSKSIIAVAERGSGKSATRLILEARCAPKKRSGIVLGIPFIDFDGLGAGEMSDSDRIPLRHYVDRIIAGGLTLLVEMICERPRLFAQLQLNERYLLCSMIRTYTNFTENWKLSQIAQRAGLQEHAIRILHGDTTILKHEYGDRDEKEQQIIQFMQMLIEPGTIDLEWERRSTRDIFNRFVVFALSLGSQAVYIFVDGIDELPATTADPILATQLIQPLLTHLWLLEQPLVAFKFFLPAEIAEHLQATEAVRFDRVPVVEIRWTEEQLLELLRNRIQHYCPERNYDSLDPLSEPELRGRIDFTIVENATGSPRRMLRLAELVILEHCTVILDDPEPLILHEDVDRALQRYKKEMNTWGRNLQSDISPTRVQTEALPLLTLNETSRQVYVGNRPLAKRLTKSEFDLLAYIYRRRGEACGKDEIAMAVYGLHDLNQVPSDESISQIVYRLRQKVSSRYITTVRGVGYRLEHASDDDQSDN